MQRQPSILLASADAPMRDMMREHLGQAGFDVGVTDSGRELAELLGERPIDIVVADNVLADTDGLTLRRKLFLNPAFRDIPFLVFTSGPRLHDTDFSLRPGLDGIIEKPCDPLFLIARVQSVLSSTQAQKRAMRIDPVTRVLNWAVFEQEARNDLARLERYKRFGSLAVLGMDEPNGSDGASELLLAGLAGMLAGRIRTTDLLGRDAGAGLALYLPETRLPGAQLMLERLLDQFAAASEALAGGRATFSAGIAEAPRDGSELSTLRERALAAMRRARAEGAARVMPWEEAS